MVNCLFERATGLYLAGATGQLSNDDPGGKVLVRLDRYPDRRGERWDGGSGVRPATAEEIAEVDDADLEREADQLDPNLRALIRALNRPPGHRAAFVPGSGYDAADIRRIIKRNRRGD